MNPNFINSETLGSTVIIVILTFGLIFFAILKLYRRQQGKNLLASFKKSAIKNLAEARQPGLAIQSVFEKLWYMSLSLIALYRLGDPKWRLKDIGTNEKEIFDLLEISSLNDIKSLVQLGVKSAEDIIFIIERCKEDSPVA